MTARWLSDLRARANRPPRTPREALFAAESQIGSVEAGFLHQISVEPSQDGREQLLKKEHDNSCSWHLQGNATAALHAVAVALRQAGLAGAWRDEQLAVTDSAGRRIGTVERAAVRPLGIATQAVHLLAQTPDGRHWAQQRAWNKSNDPGMWDTLVGGMVAANDTLDTALQRETREEAGLHLADLQGLAHGGHLLVRGPSVEAGGAGYVLEQIDWYRCIVPDGLLPVNQDGEVAQFALMDEAELMQALQRGRFTPDASLLLAALLNLD
jgi:8-oxo-dGTP pyrophosphatase MutT (NUDIX family)